MESLPHHTSAAEGSSLVSDQINGMMDDFWGEFAFLLGVDEKSTDWTADLFRF